ncbi:MAG: hydratase, partial [Crocosphaera sp.]
QGNSNALLGNPLNVVFWLKEQLNSQGKTLQKGDLLSLGTITPLIPVKAGKTITAEYQGLQEDQIIEISVTFE